jgi:hypothetical protein
MLVKQISVPRLAQKRSVGEAISPVETVIYETPVQPQYGTQKRHKVGEIGVSTDTEWFFGDLADSFQHGLSK